MPKSDKVIIVPLTEERTFLTKGQTSGNEAIYVVAAGVAERIGPFMEKLRIVWEGTEFSTNMSAKVRMAYSVTGCTWSSPVTLLSDQVADGQAIGAYYSTEANFGPRLRFEIVCWNATGSAIESGTITAFAEIVLRS